jgi:hypothetical protein
MNSVIAQGSPNSIIRKIQDNPLMAKDFIEWIADFDCDKENCFNHSHETDGGEDFCMPCKAKEFLK